MLRLKQDLEPGRAIFGELVEPCGADPVVRENAGNELGNQSRAGAPAPHKQRIDEVVVTYFAKPHSYTRDDIVEISTHGSPVVLRHIVEVAMASGARLAEPGEFTMRAFLNGRIDLTQAEAVRDLIESQTLFQAKVAAQQLGGALSRRLQPTKQKLVELIALLEAGIDFAEDDVAVLPQERIMEQIASIRAPLAELAESFAYGKVVHEGLSLAIVGRPNVGKSSLFNRLVERERAIVTATPGTTRDLVSETVSLSGIPVRLTDTAGLRAASDEAETIGVRKSYEALAEADVVLLVTECSAHGAAAANEDERLLQLIGERPHLVVGNKSDLAAATSHQPPAASHCSLRTSALTGEGMEELRSEILRCVRNENGAQQESGMLTNLRQQQLVRQSLAALEAATGAVHNSIPHEMLLLDLYNALRALDSLTGATTTDDILNLIFSSFCIGK